MKSLEDELAQFKNLSIQQKLQLVKSVEDNKELIQEIKDQNKAIAQYKK